MSLKSFNKKGILAKLLEGVQSYNVEEEELLTLIRGQELGDYISIRLFNKIKSIYFLSYLKALKVIALKLLNISKDLLYRI